jgi:hypothetical protein
MKDQTQKPPITTNIYECTLDFLEWGKSANLFCFFTNIETQKKYRLSVWFNNGYKPRKGNVSFKDAELGKIYRIEIKDGENGKLPTFVDAELLN